jgi:hypothetical protein
MTKSRTIPALIVSGLLLLIIAGYNRRPRLEDLYTPSGQHISLVNNPAAKDVTYDELVGFLIGYQWPTAGNLTCGLIAEDLHDKAEAAGIRAGIGIVQLPSSWHGFNVFSTTDAGRVFVDASWGIEIIRKFDSTFEFYQIFNDEVVPISPYGVLAEPLLQGHERDIYIFW